MAKTAQNQFKEVILSDCIGYLEVNLSKNLIVSEIYGLTDEGLKPCTCDFRLGKDILFSTFVEKVRRDFVITNKDEFAKLSNPEALLTKFEEGEWMPDVYFWTMTPKNNKYCFHLTYYLYEDKGDVMALAVAKDYSDTMRQIETKNQLEGVINGLASEYTWILYVDLDRDRSWDYRITEKYLPFWDGLQHLHGFHDMAESLIREVVVKEEQDALIARLSKDVLLHDLEETPTIYERYRVNVKGKTHYFTVKITKDNNRPNRNFVIIGVRNVDTFVKTEKKNQKEAAKSKEIIQVLSSDFTSVYYVDLESDMLTTYSMNDDTEKTLGGVFEEDMSFSEAYKEYVDKIVFRDDKKKMLMAGSISNIKKQLTDKKSITTVYRADNNGKPRYCEMKIVKVGDLEGEEPMAIALGFVDRHDEIRKEEHRKQLLEVAKRRAEAANKAKTVFLFNMSHDIRTPMNAILGYTSMAKRYLNNPEKVMECLGKLEVSGEHLLKLINDVLDMARIESGKIVIEEEEANIIDCCNRLVDIIADQIEEKDLKLIVDTEDVEDPEIFMDVMRVGRIALNILSNSIKYTRNGGVINLTVRQVENQKDIPGHVSFDLIITDNGIGMSEEFIKEHLFETFARQNSSTISGIQGTGLGMSIAKNLLELMGGTIEVESTLNVGTKVTCHCHFRKVTKSHKPVEIIPGDYNLLGKRVLLVEDNDLNREIAKDTLENEGIIVEEATDGTVAVEMVKKSTPGYYYCILMDIQMPIMDGYKATEEIRHLPDPHIANIPIVAMTANAFAEDKKKALDAGMNAHLGKPVKLVDLMETLAAFKR